jgi:hypothetical protein
MENINTCPRVLPGNYVGCDGQPIKQVPDTNQDNHRLQAKELEAADIPDHTKKLIAVEYIRLCRLHPKWKAYKAMRKAGEKFNVKFVFE